MMQIELGTEANPLEAYTDGGCSPNPGEGGWAFLIKDIEKCYGYVRNSTNSEMELMAMLECLKKIGNRYANIYSDSTYTVMGLTKWSKGWIKGKWRTTSGTPVANKDLWIELLKYYNPEKHNIQHVKGHANNLGNETVDSLVHEARYRKMNKIEIPVVSKDSLVHDIRGLVTEFENQSEYDKMHIAHDVLTEISRFKFIVSKYL